ncbi:hypothetical protein H0H87_003307 [Tephrocybe sp. NHM501043]|nr:hypothetical protein H0H87_003307 [Tephrocybe sp. NHM501043]
MPIYTFIDNDLLNTAILPDDPDRFISYTTKTTSSLQAGPKNTQFIPSVNDEHNILEGEINWKEETFSIAGLATRCDELRSKPDGVKDSTREWHWIGKKYWVKYHDNIWRARVGSAHANAEATFTLRKSRLLSQSDPATIDFIPGVSSRDRLFLLLVFVFCETKRQERKEKAALALAAGTHRVEVPGIKRGLIRK